MSRGICKLRSNTEDKYTIDEIREAFFKNFLDIGEVYHGYCHTREEKDMLNLEHWENFRNAIFKARETNK